MITLGITGPTGCGKTTFLQEITACGGEVVDCDALYYALLKKDPELRAALQEAFGDVFFPDGSLDRQRLAACVFSDGKQLARLNEIVFFYVGRAVKALQAHARRSQKPMFAIDAINLIESGMGESCDAVIGVLAPRQARLARIMARDGLTEAAANARINAQKPDDFYRRHCRYLLTNDTTLDAFRAQARCLLQNILKEETP